MTKIQEAYQCPGPHRPTALTLGLMLLKGLPEHVEIVAITIKGQGGGIIVETLHEGLRQDWWFNERGVLELAPVQPKDAQ